MDAAGDRPPPPPPSAADFRHPQNCPSSSSFSFRHRNPSLFLQDPYYCSPFPSSSLHRHHPYPPPSPHPPRKRPANLSHPFPAPHQLRFPKKSSLLSSPPPSHAHAHARPRTNLNHYHRPGRAYDTTHRRNPKPNRAYHDTPDNRNPNPYPALPRAYGADSPAEMSSSRSHPLDQNRRPFNSSAAANRNPKPYPAISRAFGEDACRHPESRPHADSADASTARGPNPNPDALACVLCAKQFHSVRALGGHMRIHGGLHQGSSADAAFTQRRIPIPNEQRVAIRNPNQGSEDTAFRDHKDATNFPEASTPLSSDHDVQDLEEEEEDAVRRRAASMASLTTAAEEEGRLTSTMNLLWEEQLQSRQHHRHNERRSGYVSSTALRRLREGEEESAEIRWTSAAVLHTEAQSPPSNSSGESKRYMSQKTFQGQLRRHCGAKAAAMAMARSTQLCSMDEGEKEEQQQPDQDSSDSTDDEEEEEDKDTESSNDRVDIAVAAPLAPPPPPFFWGHKSKRAPARQRKFWSAITAAIIQPAAAATAADTMVATEPAAADTIAVEPPAALEPAVFTATIANVSVATKPSSLEHPESVAATEAPPLELPETMADVAAVTIKPTSVELPETILGVAVAGVDAGASTIELPPLELPETIAASVAATSNKLPPLELPQTIVADVPAASIEPPPLEIPETISAVTMKPPSDEVPETAGVDARFRKLQASEIGASDSAINKKLRVALFSADEILVADALLMLQKTVVVVGDLEEEVVVAETEKGAAAIRGGGAYKCATCGKGFCTPQALGGHRASSHKATAAGAAHDSGRVVALNLQNGGAASDGNSCHHECTVCRRVFSTGQALGGHKRCHWSGPAAEAETSKPAVSGGDARTDSAEYSVLTAAEQQQQQQKKKKKGIWLIDLNMPAPMDWEVESGGMLEAAAA